MWLHGAAAVGSYLQSFTPALPSVPLHVLELGAALADMVAEAGVGCGEEGWWGTLGGEWARKASLAHVCLVRANKGAKGARGLRRGVARLNPPSG